MKKKTNQQITMIAYDSDYIFEIHKCRDEKRLKKIAKKLTSITNNYKVEVIGNLIFVGRK